MPFASRPRMSGSSRSAFAWGLGNVMQQNALAPSLGIITPIEAVFIMAASGLRRKRDGGCEFWTCHPELFTPTIPSRVEQS